MKFTVLLLLFLAYTFITIGQSDIVSIELNNGTIEELVKQVEEQTNYYFYYDITEFDSLKINISVKEKHVNTVLDAVFFNSNYSFVIDHASVFFTSGAKFRFPLPVNYFDIELMPKTISDNSISDELKPAIWENKLYEIGEKQESDTRESVTISGRIFDGKSGEPMIGASVFIEQPRIGMTTDAEGFYSLELPKGRHTIHIGSVGAVSTLRQILINGDGVFNIELSETITALEEVIITAQRESNVKSTIMGLQKVEIKAIKKIPVVLGEADVLKVITMMPGVKTTGEASTGLNVRGGSTDQNLILFNDAPVFNPSHFFGMFSAFNPEVVQDVELYKSSIPAKYGGRLASVLNINTREGNKEKFEGSTGIGLLTSRLNLEGPLNKGKTSFIIGGRTTYANWLLDKLPEPYKGSKASFYDVNLVISHEVNTKNDIYFSAYLSQDAFNLNSDTLFGYSSRNASLKWKHTYTDKLSGVFSLGHSAYQYQISSEKDIARAFKLGFDINQSFLKADFNYYVGPKHTLEFGINSLLYKLHPGSYMPFTNESLIEVNEISAEQALESALYFSDAYTISDKLTLDAGVRVSIFNNLGPHDINEYAEGLPRSEINRINTISEAKGILKTYGTPEYRASMRYVFNNNLSLKAGFNTQQQYIHSISNTAAVAPTDVWKLSDSNIKPQSGNQISVGVYNNLKSNLIETSVELYYKNIKNFLDYKSGAQLIMNHHLETDVIATKGKAYGVEVLVKKNKGKLNGWLSYTWSRILLKQDDPLAGELINEGQFYPANYDKPHDITLIANYRFTKRFSASFNTTYSTGRPITLPSGVYNYAGSVRTLYLERNGYRIPDYFRADVALNLDGNHRLTQKTHNFWSFGVYNLTGRKNPYSVFYISEGGKTNGYKLSIFGSAIPFINFNIRF
jgi:hypothetical protein